MSIVECYTHKLEAELLFVLHSETMSYSDCIRLCRSSRSIHEEHVVLKIRYIPAGRNISRNLASSPSLTQSLSPIYSSTTNNSGPVFQEHLVLHTPECLNYSCHSHHLSLHSLHRNVHKESGCTAKHLQHKESTTNVTLLKTNLKGIILPHNVQSILLYKYVL